MHETMASPGFPFSSIEERLGYAKPEAIDQPSEFPVLYKLYLRKLNLGCSKTTPFAIHEKIVQRERNDLHTVFSTPMHIPIT